MFLRIFAGTLGVAVTGTSVAAAATNGFDFGPGIMPDCYSLPIVGDDGKNDRKLLVGDAYSGYKDSSAWKYAGFISTFVDPEHPGNKDWWEWSYRQFKRYSLRYNRYRPLYRYKGSYSIGKYEIKSGYGESGDQALNQVCKKAIQSARLGKYDHVNFLDPNLEDVNWLTDIDQFCFVRQEDSLSTTANDWFSVRRETKDKRWKWSYFDPSRWAKPLYKDAGFFVGSGDDKVVKDVYKGKFGDEKQEDVAGMDERNSAWWNYKYEELLGAKDIAKAFRYKEGQELVILSGFSSDPNNTTALNRVCDAIYKSDKQKITEKGDGDGEYKRKDVEKHCFYYHRWGWYNNW